MRRAAVAWGVLLALVLLAVGLVHHVDRATSTGGQAEAATDEAAAAVVRSLSRTRYDTHEAVELARVATAPGVEVLAAAGDRYAGTIELLVRVTTTGYYAGLSGSGDRVTDVRCYRIVQAGTHDFAGPREKRCPAGASPTALPTPPPDLPPGYADRLAAALQALPPTRRADPAAVEVAARAALSGSPATIGTARSGPTTGVAVSTGRYECVLAAVDATVDVWRPPPVSLEPGEGGCSAEVAARRQSQRDPH